MTKPMQNMSAEEFDEYFDDGGDISELFTEQATTWPNLDTKKVNVDFTLRQLDEIDAEAAYLGINRQACIKTLIDEALLARDERRAHVALERLQSHRLQA